MIMAVPVVVKQGPDSLHTDCLKWYCLGDDNMRDLDSGVRVCRRVNSCGFAAAV